jgi:hypothetical protein
MPISCGRQLEGAILAKTGAYTGVHRADSGPLEEDIEARLVLVVRRD